MKNIIKITAIFIFLILIFNIKSFAQPVLDNPQGEPTVDCKTQIVDPEIEFTYPPDDPGDDGIEDSDGLENIPPSDNEEKFRRIWFVHGYQGSISSWEKVATHYKKTPNRKFDTYNMTYETSEFNTLEGVAGQIQNVYLNGSESWPVEIKRNSFFIAHSMGGMALKYMHNFFVGIEKPYAGMITVGTGHKGVYSADVLSNHKKVFTDFASNTCATVVHDLVYPNLPEILKSFIIIPVIFDKGYLKSSFCEKYGVIPFEFFLSEKIEKELTPEQAKNWPKEIGIKNENKLALYGIEEDEMIVEIKDKYGNKREELVTDILLPKFYGSMVDSPTDYHVFTADATDDYGLKTFSETINNFEKRHEQLKSDLNYALLFNQYANVSKIKSKLEANYNLLIWLRDVNFQYQQLIGGFQEISIASGTCSCILEDVTSNNQYYYEYTFSGNCEDLIGTYIYGFYVIDSYRRISISAQKFASDGFVLEESAKAFPGALEPIKLNGSGHLQMRNDSSLGKNLNEIFFGNSYPIFFNLNR